MNINRALFLDRDGVINVDYGHVHKIDDFHFNSGVFELCNYFKKNNYLIIIITNQAGIAKGYYDEDQFHKLNNWMISKFKENGIEITKVYYCPHHPNYQSCECRKPNPGMLKKASKEFNLDLENSFLIGDKDTDINAAKNAGMKYFLKV
jgi:D-glycero-D-manno-heptose 1,7-bisphosphate phosphatase